MPLMTITVTGKLWNYADWRDALGRDFEIFGDSMRRDRPQAIEEENETLHTSRKGPDVQSSPGKGVTVERETEIEIENAECNPRKGQKKRVHFRELGTETVVDAVDTDPGRTLLHLMLLLPGKGQGVA